MAISMMAKTSDGEDVQLPHDIDMEDQFNKLYEKYTGSRAHQQYVSVSTKDGKTHRMLGYQVDDGAYVPRLHGVDGPHAPFGNHEKLGQIPSERDVAQGKYVPAQSDTTPVEPNAPTSSQDVQPQTQAPPVDGQFNVMNQGQPTVQPSGQPTQPGPQVAAGGIPLIAAPSNTDPVQPGVNGVPPQTTDDSLDKSVVGHTVDPRVAQVADIRNQAAGRTPDHITPHVSPLALLGGLAIAGFAGREGGNFVKGAIGGVQQATQTRQDLANQEFQAQQNASETQAKGLEKQIQEKQSVDAENNKGALTLIADRTRKDIAAQGNAIKQQNADTASRRVQSNISIAAAKIGPQMLRAVADMDPAGKRAALAQAFPELAANDPEALDAMSKLTAKQYNEMADTGYKIAQTRELTDPNSATNILKTAQAFNANTNAAMTALEMKGQESKNAMLILDVKAYPQELLDKHNKNVTGAALQRAQIQKIKNEVTRQDGSIGATPTATLNQIAAFTKEGNKADAASASEAEIQKSLKEQLDPKKQGSLAFRLANMPADMGGIGSSAQRKDLQKKLDATQSAYDASVAAKVGYDKQSELTKKTIADIKNGAASQTPQQQLVIDKRADAIKAGTWTPEKEAAFKQAWEGPVKNGGFNKPWNP